MGFIKSEWTVSYGYGFATALGAAAIWREMPIGPTTNPVFLLHAASLLFYGLRLNLFLYIRNRTSARMKEFQKTLEKRAQEKGNRLARTPFVLSCGLLYYGLVLPAVFVSKLESNTVPALALLAMKALVGLQWVGFLVGAVGDLTKSYVKESKKDGKFLVTSGVFSLLRHPNYTGEIVSWTCNAMIGTLAAACLLRGSQLSLSLVSQWVVSALGWAGIVFVLLQATQNLENRHEREHGDTEKYQEWIKSSWSGWKLSMKKKSSSTEKVAEPHEITMDDETKEDSGSGI
jgi:steroid 5-alpha reductase family enzyme